MAAWRGRLELWRSTETAQVYHAVRTSRDLAPAGEHIRLAAVTARRIAVEELGTLLATLRADGYQPVTAAVPLGGMPVPGSLARSEEHTSELQSPCNLVCRLLLEKKKHKEKLLHRINKQETTIRA